MGRVPDDDIARDQGVSRQAVGQARRQRGIPAFAAGSGAPLKGTISLIEKRELVRLERALTAVLNGAGLTAAAADDVARCRGWRVGIRRAQSKMNARGRVVEGRVLAFRFIPPGRRAWTRWMPPAEARAWLIQAGWVDYAEQRVATLKGVSK